MSNVNSEFSVLNAIVLISSAFALKETGYVSGTTNVIVKHNHVHHKSIF